MKGETKLNLLSIFIVIILLVVYAVDVHASGLEDWDINDYVGEDDVYKLTLYNGQYVPVIYYIGARYDEALRIDGPVVLNGHTLEVNLFTYYGNLYYELLIDGVRPGDELPDLDGDGIAEVPDTAGFYGPLGRITEDDIYEKGIGFSITEDGRLYISVTVKYQEDDVLNTRGKNVIKFGALYDYEGLDYWDNPYGAGGAKPSPEELNKFIAFSEYYDKTIFLELSWYDDDGKKTAYASFPTTAEWSTWGIPINETYEEYWFTCNEGYSILYPNGTWYDYFADDETMLSGSALVDISIPATYYEPSEGQAIPAFIKVYLDGVELSKNDIYRLPPGETDAFPVLRIMYQYKDTNVAEQSDENFQMSGVVNLGGVSDIWSLGDYGKVSGEKWFDVKLSNGDLYNMVFVITTDKVSIYKAYNLNVRSYDAPVDEDFDGIDDISGSPVGTGVPPPSGGIIGYLKWIVDTIYSGIVGFTESVGKIFGSIAPLIDGVRSMVSWLPVEVQSIILLSVTLGFILRLAGRS